MKQKKCFIHENFPCSTMPMLNRDMGPNMMKATMDLTTNLKYLFGPMKTLPKNILTLELVVRLNMVAKGMKWLNRHVGVTTKGRFMAMFTMNRT